LVLTEQFFSLCQHPFSPLNNLSSFVLADQSSERNNDNPLKIIFLNNKVDIEELKNDNLSIENLRLQIGGGVFRNRNNLGSITFPRNLWFFYNNAFDTCLNLNSIDLRCSLNLSYIGNSSFASCYNLSEIKFQKEVNVPLIISQNAFASCQSLIHFNGTPVGFIHATAFINCTSLEIVNLPNIERIGLASSYIIFVDKDNTEPLNNEFRAEALENGFNPVRDFPIKCYDNFSKNRVFNDCVSLREVNLGPNLYHMAPFSFVNVGNRYVKVYRYNENTNLVEKKCEISYIYENDNTSEKKIYFIPKSDFVFNDKHEIVSFYLNNELITPKKINNN
jgi:hypothetical protein